MNFNVQQISKMFGVSTSTIFRNLRQNNFTVRSSYTTITNEELSNVVVNILRNQPNTGYKRMKGHLLHRGVKVTDRRVREVMRFADPLGVYQRTMRRNNVIRRRKYYVKYSNQMWHLDGNHKLIRWGIVIRSGIDGKSRTVTYMEATDNNRADTHLNSFIDAVQIFGVPLRTRSDKGKENVAIARFMINTRGVGRSSHICGRSVHNQRIERHWRDLFYGCTSMYYALFSALESDGLLALHNEKHMALLHRIFLPRLNRHLTEFRNGWNHHPLSSERNRTPLQLMLLNLPPPEWDIELDTGELFGAELLCNGYEDLELVDVDGDSVICPIPPCVCLSESELDQLSRIDVLRDSQSFGYDIYEEALAILEIE